MIRSWFYTEFSKQHIHSNAMQIKYAKSLIIATNHDTYTKQTAIILLLYFHIFNLPSVPESRKHNRHDICKWAIPLHIMTYIMCLSSFLKLQVIARDLCFFLFPVLMSYNITQIQGLRHKHILLLTVVSSE